MYPQATPLKMIIAQNDPADKTVWLLTSTAGFTIIKEGNKKTEEVLPSLEVKITVKSGKLYCNGKKVSTERLIIIPLSGSLSLEQTIYTGEIIVEKNEGHFTLIHAVPALPKQEKAMTEAEKTVQPEKNLTQPPKKKSRDCTVRVMLDSKITLHSKPWVLESSQGFMVCDPREASSKKQIVSSPLKITVKDDALIYLNNKPYFKGQILIQPQSKTTTFDGNQYKGVMWIVVGEQTVKIINCIGLEDYVESVLCTETWPGWPLEVNKVCAIVSRTYVIAMVQKAKANNCLYHVRNTNKHQTYRGGIAPAVIKQAIKETEGMFLAYKNQPIMAMFDSCCGGIITAKMAGIDFVHHPYLSRTYPCTYCKSCKVYSWQARYNVQDLINALKEAEIKVHRIRDMNITKKDRAGIVQEVIFKGARHHHLSGKKIYSLFNKKVKSLSFSVEKKGDSVIFKGQGLGHQLGLCQWGAREMVRLDFDYKTILTFYYPETQLMRLL